MRYLTAAWQYLNEPVNCALNFATQISNQSLEFVKCVYHNITGV